MSVRFFFSLNKISAITLFSHQNKFIVRSRVRSMSSNKCSVAVCQFTATNNKQKNLEVVKRLVSQAADKQAKIAFLPEGCDYIGSSKEESRALAEPLSGPIMTEYRNLARNHKIWLSIGGFHELDSLKPSKIYNSHVLIDDHGEVKSMYKKLHLFDVSIPEKNINLRESDVTEGGYEVLPPIKTPAGPLSLSICYDLRFPELSLLLRKQGAAILTYPSAFTYATGKIHWEVLLRARAIENQCYVIAAAQYGKHNEKRTSYGQSLVIDPWGKVLAECPKYTEGTDTNESIAIATIDPQLVNQIRSEMPVFEHRRGDIYQLKLLQRERFSIFDDENFLFANKVIPGSTVFYRTGYSFAFTNLRCVVPGHVLISSIRPVKRLGDLNEDEVADLFKTGVKVQKVVETIYKSESSTICVQDGKHAGQTVPHVHIHILPRQPNDFNRNDDIYDTLSKHDRDENPNPVRTLQEMSEEAKLLRAYFS